MPYEITTWQEHVSAVSRIDELQSRVEKLEIQLQQSNLPAEEPTIDPPTTEEPVDQGQPSLIADVRLSSQENIDLHSAIGPVRRLEQPNADVFYDSVENAARCHIWPNNNSLANQISVSFDELSHANSSSVHIKWSLKLDNSWADRSITSHSMKMFQTSDGVSDVGDSRRFEWRFRMAESMQAGFFDLRLYHYLDDAGGSYPAPLAELHLQPMRWYELHERIDFGQDGSDQVSRWIVDDAGTRVDLYDSVRVTALDPQRRGVTKFGVWFNASSSPQNLDRELIAWVKEIEVTKT